MNRILGVLAIAVFVVALLALTFYPDIPTSFLGWVTLIVLGVPAYIFLEWLGEVVWGSQFFKRRSSFTRIVIGVPVALILVVVVLFVISLVHQSIDTISG